MLDSRWASIDAFAENNRDNILRDITMYNRIKSFFIGSGTELKGGIPEDDTKL